LDGYTAQPKKMEQNVYTFIKCFDYVFADVQRQHGARGKRITKVVSFSDGCAHNYKNKYMVYIMTLRVGELALDEWLHIYAPTACFKGPWDTAGERC